MRRIALLIAPLALAACTEQSSGVKVIVGARLIAAPGREPIEYSVVVIQGGKIRAAGPQSSTPVPKGAEIIRGLGMTVEPPPEGDAIEPGRPANLLLIEAPSGSPASGRIMRNGEWVK